MKSLEDFYELLKEYRKAKKFVDLYNKGYVICKEPNESNNDLNDYNNTIAFVDTLLDLLSESEREVIINDFINKQEKIWWFDKYSRSCYYRLRKQSISDFIDFSNLKCEKYKN